MTDLQPVMIMYRCRLMRYGYIVLRNRFGMTMITARYRQGVAGGSSQVRPEAWRCGVRLRARHTEDYLAKVDSSMT